MRGVDLFHLSGWIAVVSLTSIGLGIGAAIVERLANLYDAEWWVRMQEKPR